MMERLICLTGPRGAGKETLIQPVLTFAQSFSRIVPFTTREKRDGETHGKEYLFIKPEEFLFHRNNGDTLYLVQIGEDSDPKHYFSGTLRSEFDKHTNGIIDITVEGARILSHHAHSSLLFYVYATPEERLGRIMQRQNMSKEEALALMSNEPSPATEATIDKLYPEFSIVYNHDGGQGEAEALVKRVIQEFHVKKTKLY